VIKRARAIPCTPIYGKAILNPLKPVQPSVQLDTLPRLPRDEGGPVFAEPWQAQSFALAVKLSELGHFTWNERAAALADELKADAARGEADDGSRYYHCWLAALERLVVELSDPATLRRAKRRGPTPLGTPRTACRSNRSTTPARRGSN
jgi:nitrile hydratase accessory protein